MGRPTEGALGGAGSRLPHAVLIALAVAAAAAVHASTVTLFFFQDDYVAFGEIVANGPLRYVRNLLVLGDLTPNWRVFTGLTYLASYELFGMEAWPTRAVMLALHLGSVGLLYRAAWRISGSAAAAFAAATIFGTSPAYAGTFGQLGSVTYTWAAFFLLAALCAVLESGATDGRPSLAWLAGGAALYACAIASNESMAILFPVYPLAVFATGTDDLRERLGRAALRGAPFAALGLAAALAFTACDCTAAEDTFGTANAHRAVLIYAGRLLYPIGLEPPHYIDPPHVWAGAAVLAVAAGALAFGPALSRLGAAWMLLAIVPHALIETHTAHRFVYLATPGFAMLVGGFVGPVGRWLAARDPRLAVACGVAAFALVVPWYAYQSHAQTAPYRRATGDWRLLHDELARVFPSVPEGATVEVIGGPLTHPLDNFYVMPALGETLWGRGRGLQTMAPDDPHAPAVREGRNPFAAEFEGRRLVPLRRE